MKTITLTIKPEDEKNDSLLGKLISIECKKLGLVAGYKAVLEKRSVDARKGRVKIFLRYKVFENGEDEALVNGRLPEWKKADGKHSVIIVGAGPAGLFGALKLLEKGIKPVVIERGEMTFQRRKDIALISTQKKVNSDSNYCFGEGGAGTFSDGKLYTRSNKRGDISKILAIFAHFGADPKIQTDAHPHIGTDKLPLVINNMRNAIIELGGEFHFGEKVTGLVKEGNRVKGVICENVKTGDLSKFTGDAILLATGHSASDVYQMLAKEDPESLEAKTFAIGVRVEHPRELIDRIQLHGKTGMGAAEYRLVTQVKERGVYSFCMCPGGFVVPSSSSDDEIVVNGMSAAKRNSNWSNAAIVVETRPEDIPQEFEEMAIKAGCKALSGLYYRTYLEGLAKSHGDGQSAPAQMMTDFLEGRESLSFPKTSYTPGLKSSRLDQWLPSCISSRLKQGFEDFNKSMKGFISKDALMIAIETRTSTPVRILRNKDTMECNGLKGLYPCGEGSGYAGGIVSSAMDGENACTKITESLL